MKNTTEYFPIFSMLLLLFIGLPGKNALSQCTIPFKLFHTSGTVQMGCTAVTVTSTGSAGSGLFGPCFYGPHFLGEGSYIFSFSPPIPGAVIDVEHLDHKAGEKEELVVAVNGSFYPLTDPGTPDGCYEDVILTPSGTLESPPDTAASSKDIYINENMNLLEVENRVMSTFPPILGGIAINVYICCPICVTDAGEIPANTLDLCPGELASLPPAVQTVLESDDLLEYILFTDPADTLGSIISTNNIPEFAFDPATMQLSVTYYIAAIAGDDINGNVDITYDPCLDISNAVEVQWHPYPTVAFSSPVTDLCPNNCYYDIEIDFTGTPPFYLQGEMVDADGNIFIIDETYTTNTWNYIVCLAGDTPIGALTIQATSLTDYYCSCK